MAFTYGFFNSLKGDRKYNAEQISEIFDGLITDGIISGVEGLFAVTSANNGMQINVAPGRAWFDHTWSKNDSVMVLTVPLSDVTQPRYDAVVLEVNHEQNVRANTIKIVSGTPSPNPVKPTLSNAERIHQYALAYILVPAGVEEIKNEDIENNVGLNETPFATGVLKSASLNDLWAQWKGEWETWFAGIKLQLSGDIVTNLQYQIEELRTAIKDLEKSLSIVETVHTELFTSSSSFVNPFAKELTVTVKLFGGGGGGCSGGTYYYQGGGGGHMADGVFTLKSRESVPITVGPGGAQNGNGGTTSFGSYISASGGSVDGSGGTGGGGSYQTSQYSGKGGNATYGGGGGGGGGSRVSSNSGAYPGASGGSGGVYGGGGGGGGGFGSSSIASYSGGSGGAKGTYGAAGGRGGTLSAGLSGGTGRNTLSMDLEFKGSGSGGSGGTYAVYNDRYTSGGGGGGGGYGGSGGTGGGRESMGSDSYGEGSAGGGGGGYGANGGNGGAGTQHSSGASGAMYAGGGGGGGGYGGAGGDSNYSGTGYGAGGSGGRSTSNATYVGGGGGGGYGVSLPSVLRQYNGNGGICIVTYVTRELTLS